MNVANSPVDECLVSMISKNQWPNYSYIFVYKHLIKLKGNENEHEYGGCFKSGPFYSQS